MPAHATKTSTPPASLSAQLESLRRLSCWQAEVELWVTECALPTRSLFPLCTRREAESAPPDRWIVTDGPIEVTQLYDLAGP